jgi:hypothetical protein
MKHLGKIESVKFGHVGYQGAMLGIAFTFKFDESFGIGTDRCAWDAEQVEWTETCQWTEEQRSKQYDEIMRYISKLLKDAKCSDINELKGKPVELEFEGKSVLGGQLKDWRILTEVL